MENPEFKKAKAKFKLTHPECLPTEIYMGNTSVYDVAKTSWKSSRLGKQPIGANGPLPYVDLRPWFIQRSEVQAKIEIEQNKTWRTSAEVRNANENVKAWQDMLDNGMAL